MTEPDGRDHQSLREQLGAYALGHLDLPAQQPIRAHLDGCADCRAELAGIASLGPLLAEVDASRLDHQPVPPGELGARIRAAVADERLLRDARRAREERQRTQRRLRSRRLRLAAVAAALIAGASAGALLDRALHPGPAKSPSVPMEPVALRPVGGSEIRIDSANLVAHRWGVELRMTGAGFTAGEVYTAAFRERDGAMVPAGEFIGTGSDEVTCNLQSGVLRDQTVGVVISDDAGDPVARTN